MSGASSGVAPMLCRAALWLLSLPYGALMKLRNLTFDSGLRRVHRVAVPVVAVGNLTTGGTGKTPVVAMLVRQLQELGHQPGIVSRGYGADESGENDEKRVLKMMCPDVPHIQNPDRVAASQELIEHHHVTAIVLDDALQHRRIHRDLNIVLVDATNPFGFDHLLPRGLLRESASGLRRADCVLVTRADSQSQEARRNLQTTISAIAPSLSESIRHLSFLPTDLLGSDGVREAIEFVRAKPVQVATAIGNPDAFVSTCRDTLGAIVRQTNFFPDHHHFSSADLDKIQKDAEESQVVTTLVTLKDLVKIPATVRNVRAVLIESHFEDSDGQSFIRRRLQEACGQCDHQS